MLTESKLQEWISALRSGKYKQGNTIYYNRISDSYCAMGVLALVYGAKPKENYNSIYETLSKVGFEKLWKIVELNDHDKLSFEQIADWLEENKNVEFKVIND